MRLRTTRQFPLGPYTRALTVGRAKPRLIIPRHDAVEPQNRPPIPIGALHRITPPSTSASVVASRR
jgi:hypothetical protein